MRSWRHVLVAVVASLLVATPAVAAQPVEDLEMIFDAGPATTGDQAQDRALLPELPTLEPPPVPLVSPDADQGSISDDVSARPTVQQNDGPDGEGNARDDSRADTAEQGVAAQQTGQGVGDRNCEDFDTQEEAQRFFNQTRPDDPDDLDRDDDGLACETLPSAGADRTPNGGVESGFGGAAPSVSTDPAAPLLAAAGALALLSVALGGLALRRRA